MSVIAGADVVVTGGAGFIGSHFVEHALTLSPRRLTVIDDLSTGSRENLAAVLADVELVVIDAGSDEAARLVAHADVVFHLAVRNVRASINRPIENFEVNAGATLRLLEAMRRGAEGRFVYISSSEIYGIPDSAVFSESTVPAPTTVYGAGKLAGELVTLAYHRTYGMDTRVIRPFNNYGPRSHFEGDSGEVIPKFILRALTGRPLLVHGDGTQTRDFMFVEDTARWLPRLAAVAELEGDVVNIGTGQEISVLELADLVTSLTGSTSRVEHVDSRPGDLPRLCADVAKARRIAGFATEVTFAGGIQRTIDYFAAGDAEAMLAREVAHNWE